MIRRPPKLVTKEQNLLKEVREQVYSYDGEEHFRQREEYYTGPKVGSMTGGQCGESREEWVPDHKLSSQTLIYMQVPQESC